MSRCLSTYQQHEALLKCCLQVLCELGKSNWPLALDLLQGQSWRSVVQLFSENEVMQLCFIIFLLQIWSMNVNDASKMARLSWLLTLFFLSCFTLTHCVATYFHPCTALRWRQSTGNQGHGLCSGSGSGSWEPSCGRTLKEGSITWHWKTGWINFKFKDGWRFVIYILSRFKLLKES